MGMFGAILYVPIFSQGVIGGSATHAGLILTPMMLSLVVSSALSGQIISRTGRYKILAITGTAITVATLFAFSTVDEHTRNLGLILRMIFLGIGLGSTMPIFTLAVQSAFTKERLGEVTAGTQLFRSVGGTVGTAVLGGIMNNRLSVQMERLGQEPFVAQMKQFDTGSSPSHFDGSFIQGVLNPDNQQHIRSMFSRISPAQQTMVNKNFDHFIASAKVAFSDAVDMVFIVAACLMIIALIAVFFLPEIPLRKSNRPVMEEVGAEWEDEMSQTDGDHKAVVMTTARNNENRL
jgi:MFS family permease